MWVTRQTADSHSAHLTPAEFTLAAEMGLNYFSCGVIPWIFSRGLDSSRRLILLLSPLPTPPPPPPPRLRPLFLTLIFITVVKLDLLAPRQRFL